VILSAGRPAVDLASRAHSRPWITVISSGNEPDLRLCAERLQRDYGIRRISAVGGRTLATGLLDAGLVTDLYLTTSPKRGGTPNTPMYAGSRPPARELVVSKRSADGVEFEHFIVQNT
jgi:riboflavin biosynthesis pyrimidine reductase